MLLKGVFRNCVSTIRRIQVFTRNSESDFALRSGNEKWPDQQVSTELVYDFTENGYVIIRNLLNSSEIDKVRSLLVENETFWSKHGYGRTDFENRQFRQIIWSKPGTDFLGQLAGNSKTVGVAERLLGRGELYLYHGKLILKGGRTGGAVLWHQDYGYWYNNDAVFPDMLSCLIALTYSSHTNGGLEVLKSSNRCGRIEHKVTAGQQGADLERVELLKKVLPHVRVDLNPGDSVVFHSNTLHSSPPNLTPHSRCHLIFSYNTKENNPHKVHAHALYNKLERHPADALENCTQWEIEHRVG